MTLREYLDEWLLTYIDTGRAESTRNGYRQALAHLSDDILGMTMEDVNALRLQREINGVAVVMPRQAQILYAVLRCALKRAMLLGIIDKNPMERVEKPEHRTREINFLTADQLREYVNVASKDEICGAALLLMAICGLRRGEAMAQTRWDLRDGRITIRRQKDGSGKIKPCKTKTSNRILPIDEGVQHYLEHWYKTRDSACLCCARTLEERHRKILDAAGLPIITLHELRHSCATAMLSNDATMTSVQYYLGHSNYSTTSRYYAHSTDAVLLSAMRAMGKVQRGLFTDLRTTGNRVGVNSVPRVQIPNSPPRDPKSDPVFHVGFGTIY